MRHLLLVFILQMPRSIFEEMKYLEIMIVSDHSMVCVLSESNNNKKYLLSHSFFHLFIMYNW